MRVSGSLKPLKDSSTGKGHLVEVVIYQSYLVLMTLWEVDDHYHQEKSNPKITPAVRSSGQTLPQLSDPTPLETHRHTLSHIHTHTSSKQHSSLQRFILGWYGLVVKISVFYFYIFSNNDYKEGNQNLKLTLALNIVRNQKQHAIYKYI